MTEPVLVTGGSGIVGRALVRRLVADGRRVRALARTRSSAEAIGATGAEPVRGDVLDLGSLVLLAILVGSFAHVIRTALHVAH